MEIKNVLLGSSETLLSNLFFSFMNRCASKVHFLKTCPPQDVLFVHISPWCSVLFVCLHHPFVFILTQLRIAQQMQMKASLSP